MRPRAEGMRSCGVGPGGGEAGDQVLRTPYESPSCLPSGTRGTRWELWRGLPVKAAGRNLNGWRRHCGVTTRRGTFVPRVATTSGECGRLLCALDHLGYAPGRRWSGDGGPTVSTAGSGLNTGSGVGRVSIVRGSVTGRPVETDQSSSVGSVGISLPVPGWRKRDRRSSVRRNVSGSITAATGIRCGVGTVGRTGDQTGRCGPGKRGFGTVIVV